MGIRCIKNTDGSRKHTPLYGSWIEMRRRCTVKHRKEYPNYGGRGIVVCDDWQNSFDKFHEWALQNGHKDGLTIERVDNDGNYEPDNCTWITSSAQANNRSNITGPNGKYISTRRST